MIKIVIHDLNSVEIAGAQFETQDLVDSWIAANWPPSDQYTVSQEDITAQLANAQAIADAQALLASTDWMVIRQIDNGVAMPPEIKAQREAARLIINPIPKAP